MVRCIYVWLFILTNIDVNVAAASSFNLFGKATVQNSLLGRLKSIPGSGFFFTELMREYKELLMQN